MDNPILSKLQTSPGDPPSGSDGAFDREGFFAESLKLIRKVIAGRKSVPTNDMPDISQEAALRLWKWSTKFDEKSSQMAEGDWKSFTARTAHNEVNRNLSTRNKRIEVSLDETEALDGGIDASSAETFVLVKTVWQGICKLSLYQRQALIFNSVDLVLYLFQFGIEEDELLAKLELTKKSWERISTQMPLTDIEIAKIANPNSANGQRSTTAGAIKKARFDARKRLKELMK
ncbi:MAG: sigma-70 family RNA polymerase sigma factor [Acidobacteriota bacterium]|nr:MAG: sigma-70 family RNA polymerase sigma factor [Acidobacteriota bacterium]